MEIRELAQGVYALLTEVGDSRGDSNFGLITGSNGAVLIDADIRRWEETCRLIKSVTDQPVRYLINTHDNFDHTSANTILNRMGVTIIASKACRSILAGTGAREFTEKIAQDNDLKEKYKLEYLSLPDITTDARLFLDLGERTLELIFVGHAHTPGDMVAYLAADEILFAGDVLFNGCHPVTRNANTANWINILAGLGQKAIRLTVPGHGEPSGGKSNLETLQRYFEIFRSRIGELKLQGLSIEETEKQFAFPEFESWGKKNWLPVSIRKIYEELEQLKNV